MYYNWYITFIESYYFLCVKKTIRANLSKHESINMQIDRNGFEVLQKCNFLLLPSNQEHSKHLG